MKNINLTNEELADFFSEFAILRKAQISEKEALQMMSDGEGKKNRELFLTTLTQACDLVTGLKQFPTVIPEYIIALLEKNNSEVNVLEDIAEYLTGLSLTYNGVSYKQQIKAAFLYPIIVLFFLLVFSTLMLVFVVPAFDFMFKGFGKELPAFTQLFISLSQALQQNWLIFFISLVIIIQVWRFSIARFESFRKFVGEVILKTPFIGAFIKTIESAVVIKAFLLLCSYQFDLAQALRLSASATQNTVFKIALTESADNVAKGSGLADSLKQARIFSAKTLRLLNAFEKTDELKILNTLAQSYQTQIPIGVSVSLRILNVVLLIGCWIAVGSMVIAMYLPMFMMGEAVG